MFCGCHCLVEKKRDRVSGWQNSSCAFELVLALFRQNLDQIIFSEIKRVRSVILALKINLKLNHFIKNLDSQVIYTSCQHNINDFFLTDIEIDFCVNTVEHVSLSTQVTNALIIFASWLWGFHCSLFSFQYQGLYFLILF